MTAVRLRPMPAADLEDWRAERHGTDPLPDLDDDAHEALHVLVDDAVVGRALLAADPDDPTPGRWTIRALETTLASDDTETWADLLTRVAERARGRGAGTLDTRLHPLVAPASEVAGFRATATLHAKRLAADAAFQDDLRVAVRAMDDDERAAFVADARAMLAAGVLREVHVGPGRTPGGIATRLDRLALAPVPEELLRAATVDGEVVGRVWATLVRDPVDGSVDFVGHVIDLAPARRGDGLTPSFLGALAREVRRLGVRDVYVRVPGDEHRVRGWFLDAGFTTSDVEVRRDLR